MKTEVNPMRHAPRCGAKTRSGKPCQGPAIHGHRRCRMHGGRGSGAPVGNTNALKHGRYTKAAKTERKQARQVTREIAELIALARHLEATCAKGSRPHESATIILEVARGES